MNTIVSASILSADLCRLGEELDRAEKCGCDHIHFDVMDGVFVNNISYGIPVLASVRKHTKMFIDVHLMITDPIRYIDAFADNGADMISFHLEAAPDPAAVISAIKAKGKKAGIAIKPATPVSDVLPYAESADMILIMTVDPGFGGQGFIYESLDKIRELKAYLDSHSLSVHIQVDGGINDKTSASVREAGADILVAGSYLFKADDMAAALPCSFMQASEISSARVTLPSGSAALLGISATSRRQCFSPVSREFSDITPIRVRLRQMPKSSFIPPAVIIALIFSLLRRFFGEM